jgi:probable phosphoglycerate mutase
VSTKPTRIFLVRHGATELSAEDRFAGDVDVALSDMGRLQARRLGVRLEPEPITAGYASPRARTQETARLALGERALTLEVEEDLREISHGRWEGQARADVERLYPDEYARWEADPYTFAPEGGETGLAVTARALPVLLRIVGAHPGETVLVVSHKATIRLLLSSLLGFDPRTYRDRLDQSPASLNVLEFKGPAKARLTLFNDVSHYAGSGSATPEVPAARLSRWWDTTPNR